MFNKLVMSFAFLQQNVDRTSQTNIFFPLGFIADVHSPVLIGSFLFKVEKSGVSCHFEKRGSISSNSG